MSKPWSYNSYRATLKRDGKFFALVTPDGKKALSEADAVVLVAALNKPPVVGLSKGAAKLLSSWADSNQQFEKASVTDPAGPLAQCLYLETRIVATRLAALLSQEIRMQRKALRKKVSV